MKLKALHYEHGEHEPCTQWCYTRLPERPGSTIVHGHDEGQSCSWAVCYYKPGPGKSLLQRLGLRA